MTDASPKLRIRKLEQVSGGNEPRFEILFHSDDGVYRDHAGDEYTFVAPLVPPITDPRGGYWRNERSGEVVMSTIFSPESLRLRL